MRACIRWIRFRSAVVVAAAIAATPLARAGADVFCSPFIPHTRTVGNKVSDVNCTDDTLQHAVDNAVCPNTSILLTQEISYGAQHVTIQDKSLSIIGTNATSCSNIGTTGIGNSPAAVPTAPLLTISGTNNGGGSVFVVRGNSNVTFQYVEITGGTTDSDGHGGGIDFNGVGSLTIDTTTIDLNSAGFGGGIEFNGNGGHATLGLSAYSVIQANTAAGNGGGINIEGDAQLFAVQPFTHIGSNHAPNGKGGGIAVVGPAEADIGSPGYAALPVIDGNDAALGGGLSISAEVDSFDAHGKLFTTDPDHPVTVSGNFASQGGGGIYVRPNSSAFSGGLAFGVGCAFNARIDGNSAPEGAAVYVDQDSVPFGGIGSGFFGFNDGGCADAPAGSVSCHRGVTCNTLNDNRTVDAGNHRTAGAVVYAVEGYANLFGFFMRGNVAAHALHVIDDSNSVNHCLIADNDFAAETLTIDDDGSTGSLHIGSCTIVGNTHNSGSVINAGHSLTLTKSIIDQPAMSTLHTVGEPVVTASDDLAADPTGLPVRHDIVQGEPIYVNPAAGNYHLFAFTQNGVATGSLGIDFTPALADEGSDLDGNPYDVDIPQVKDFQGIRDIGCYEAQPITDRIFADAFGDPISIVLSEN